MELRFKKIKKEDYRVRIKPCAKFEGYRNKIKRVENGQLLVAAPLSGTYSSFTTD